MRRLLRPPALALVLTALAAGTVPAQEVRLRPTAAVYLDASGAGMRGPQGVDFDGFLLAVADTGNGRLLLYAVDGRKIASVAQIRLPQTPYPVRIRIDSRGGLLVLDGRSHRIARVDRSGEFRGYVEVPGSGKIEPLPRSFDLDAEDNLYVLASGSGKLLVLGPDGGLQREIAYPSEARSLSDLAVGPGGAVFAVDGVGRRVFVARPGEPALRPLTEPMEDDMTLPSGIAAGADGYLYLADDHGGGIVILGQDGSFRGRESAMGWKEGFLRYPSGLCTGGDLLFVADRGNNRVQAFTIVR
jgi:hypothetical protein